MNIVFQISGADFEDILIGKLEYMKGNKNLFNEIFET